jgi:argininosuccinate synthase
MIDEKYSCLIYDGLWFSPLKNALDSFIDSFSQRLTGKVKMKLYKGSATVVGRNSEFSMYQQDLATYGQNDSFLHNSAIGFIDIFSLPNRVYHRVKHDK